VVDHARRRSSTPSKGASPRSSGPM
jgi:hypothetical protein